METPATTVDSLPGALCPNLARVAPIGLGLATMDGTLVSANMALAKTLACDDLAALIGTSLARFHRFPELAADILANRIDDDLSDDLADGVELDALRADGQDIVLRVRARLQTLDSGQTAVAFSAEDVTRHRLERQVSTHGHKMEAVVRFAAGVAHDYNNLLTTIIGEARQLIVEHPAAEEATTAILMAARRASAITKRLLVFSKSEVSRNEVISINELVTTSTSQITNAAGPDVEVSVRLDPSVGRVRIDPTHLRQILSHLATNALDAMRGGGRLVFETCRVSAPDDTDGLDYDPVVPPGRYISLAVGDNGIGMNQETRTRVFDRFFTTKPIGGGAGLGLATVYGHTLRAGGYLSILSAPAHGTVVRVLLPECDDPAKAEISDQPARDQDPIGRPKVLVVDDETSVLRVMVKVVERMGYRVLQAHDGHAAQAILRDLRGPLDLLVTDVMMPHMLGTELAQWAARERPEAGILLVSGYTDSPLVQQWVDSDPDVFLPKPFEPEDLMAAVRRRLERSQPQAPAPGARYSL